MKVFLYIAVIVCFSICADRSVAQTQTIRGQISDQDSGIALPGATVVLLNQSPVIGTISDPEGWFQLTSVPLGRHDLEVRFLGYQPLVLEQIQVTSGKEVVLDIQLKEEIVTGEGITVVAEAQKDRALNDLALVSARTFSVEETRRYAGGVDDPARMASAFAGVSTSGGVGDNALVIRGNAPKGVQWRLEGIDIMNPNHFAGLSVAGGGGLTLFSSQLLANSDFLTGAFPAEYGNALAGVFDMAFRNGNPARREHTFQLGVLGIDAASEGPFSSKSRSTYLFNYRYSTLGLLMPILPTEDFTTYQDLSFKLHFPTKKAGRFSLWGMGGLDRQRGTPTSNPDLWEYEVWDRMENELLLANGVIGLTHDLVLGSNTRMRSGLAVMGNNTDFKQKRLSDTLLLEDNLSILHSTGRLTLNNYIHHKFNPKHSNRTGFSIEHHFFDLHLEVALDDVPPLQAIAVAEGSSQLIRGYTQHRWQWGRGSLVAGLHAQHFALTEHTSVEPRLGVELGLGDNQGIHLGYGLHSQVEELRVYFIKEEDNLPNQRLDFSKAHHFVAGYQARMSANNRIIIEAFYQSLFDIPVIPDSSYSMLNFEQDWTFNAALTNEGAGENYGVEATIERFLKDGYYYLLTGTLFKGRYRGGDQIWRSTRFDRGMTVNALVGKEWQFSNANVLGLNGRVQYMGGKKYSPVDELLSRQREEVIFDEDRAFSQQFPGILLFDLSVLYHRNHARITETWALQIKNILGAKERYFDYNFSTGEIDEIKEGFPLPVLSYKVSF